MSKQRLNKRHQLMLRWGLSTILIAVALVVVATLMTTRKDPMARNEDGSIRGLTSILERTVDPSMVTIALENTAKTRGLIFKHFPSSRSSLLPEDMGSGIAWGDWNNDGLLDLLAVDFGGGLLDGEPSGTCRLFQNEGDRFRDITSEVGLDIPVLGMAAAWADYDDDGDLDCYVTAYGHNLLMRNDGDSFSEVGEAAGVADGRFGAGCSWADYDLDGDLDLYVCNYVDFKYRSEDMDRLERQYGAEVPYTLNPSSYSPVSNLLYRNNGDGTFTDMAAAAGVEDPDGRSLGVVWFDFEGDGDMDLYIANDVSTNGVYCNNGDGTFSDIGATSLAADYRGAMGMAVGDLDRDGDDDLFVTHWIAQENALFENMVSEGWKDDDGSPHVAFTDQAEVLGLGQVSLQMVGWSAGLVDLDNDGLLDLWLVNGHTFEDPQDPGKLQRQRMQVFRQVTGEGFFEMGLEACGDLSEPIVGRGGAHADFDGDGDMDIAVLESGGDLMLLENMAETGNWLTVLLEQPPPNRRAVGAVVTVRSGDHVQSRQVGADGSYLSQHQLDAHFGFGDLATLSEVIVTWPGGEQTVLEDVACNQILRVSR